MHAGHWHEELRQDLGFALRQLRRAPVFAVIAIATLALGIGANAAIFALVDATLLRPLPFRNPEQLMMLWDQSPTSQRGMVAGRDLLEWRDRSQTFAHIAGYVPSVGGMVMDGADGTAETVPRQWVTAGVFDVLGVTPVVGRTFLPSDESSRSAVVVLSEAFWRARFHADASVLGRAIRLDGEPFTVIGVVPAEAQLIGRSSLWAMRPIGRGAQRGPGFLHVIGRVKPGTRLEDARRDMTSVAGALAQEFSDSSGRSVVVEPLQDAFVGRELRLTALLFLGVVGFVLLICCANVANLLLTRATVRAREFAIRSVLGAGRQRVFRQLLTESVVLALLGGMAGVAIGMLILQVAPAMIPEGLLPRAVTLTFDGRVLTFSAVAALLVGAIFGLAPAWQATRRSTVETLAADNRTSTGRDGALRSVLVVAEVATAVVLLFGAGLLLRTLMALEAVDRGYRATQVLTMVVDPLGSQFPDATTLQQFYESIERETRALPGVSDVAWASSLPVGAPDGNQIAFEVVGNTPLDPGKRPVADYRIVSPTYFRTIDLPLVAGRAFAQDDTRDRALVCIVSEAFVRRHLQGRSPVGARLAIRPAASSEAAPRDMEIVGVARQVKARADETEDAVQLYVPITQLISDDMYLFVRPASGSGDVLTASVRAAIARIDREQLVSVREFATLEGLAWESTGRARFRALLVLTFAAVALLLAMVGVFGILVYSLQQRMRDFGIRRALGATTSDVWRMVIGGALRVIGTGAVVGLLLSVFVGRLLESMLFGVQPLDGATIAAVTLVLLLTTALAAAGPAWRAARIDPATVLRGS